MELSEVTLSTTYWDTTDHRLLAGGHTLRHHSASDGSERTWILDLAGASRHASRVAVQRHGDASSPPGQLLERTLGVTRGATVVPIATVTVHRSRRILCRGRVELRDDRHSSEAKGRPGPSSRRVSLEAIHGDPTDELRHVAALLRRLGATTPASPSPTDGANQEALASLLALVGAPSSQIPPAMSTVDADVTTVVGSAVTRCLRRLLRADPEARSVDGSAIQPTGIAPSAHVDAIHRCRVATRRLRTDLRTLRSVLDPVWALHVHTELTWLGERLGAVRDLDVLGERLTTELRRLDPLDRHVGGAVLEEVGEQRRTAHLELVSAMSSDRYLRLIDELIRAGTTVPLRDGVDPRSPAADLLVRRTASAWRRVSSAHRDATSAADLHEFRKRVKRARYASQLTARTVGGRDRRKARRLAERLGALQDALGALHDASVATAWLDEQAPAHLPPSAAYVAGKLAERQARSAEELRASWSAPWDQLRPDEVTNWLGRPDRARRPG